MKIKYILRVFILSCLFLPTVISCSDFLDKENDTELTLPMVFTDKIRMEGMLAYVYSGIPEPSWGYLNNTGWSVLGDDWSPSERWQQWGWDAIPKILGNWNTGSDWAGNYWAGLPQRIRTANLLRANVIPIMDTNINEQEVKYIKAECQFLQAYYYMLFINTYGVCPFQPDAIAPTDGSAEELLTGPVPYDEIISWCDKEMLAAAQVLPASYSTATKYGRITSIMSLAIRARMLLFAASPLVNGNPDYANFTSNEGVALFNSTYDETKWTKALDAHKLLIDEAHAAGHELYKMYNDDGTIDPFASTQWVHARTFADGNKEILFARPQNQTEQDKHMSPSGAGGNGGLSMTQSLADAFFMENGLPAILGYEADGKTPIINSISGYTEDGFSNEDDMRKADKWNWYDGKKNVAAKAGTFNMYVNREPRFYNAILWNERFYIWDNRNIDMYKYGKDNSFTHDAPQNGYLGLKRKHPLSDSKNRSWQYRPGIIYRLAEAYLGYAEILNETNPGNPDVLKYINLVRERAGIPQYSVTSQEGFIQVNAGNKEEMRELIRRERRVELCGEGIRYDDLRRWKKAETTLNGWFYGMNFAGTKRSDDDNDPEAFYVRTPYQKRVYHKKYYFFPIFQTEIDKNPNLVQSPYWTEDETN